MQRVPRWYWTGEPAKAKPTGIQRVHEEPWRSAHTFCCSVVERWTFDSTSTTARGKPGVRPSRSNGTETSTLAADSSTSGRERDKPSEGSDEGK